MRFLLDVHQVGGQATGNETWATQVARAVRADPSLTPADELTYAVAYPAGVALAAGAETVAVRDSSTRRLAWDLPRAMRARGTDAVLVQYTSPLSRVPAVVAVHDLSFTDPASRSWIPPRERARMNATIRWSARRAHTVLALSEHGAADLERQWGIDRSRIVIAPPAVEPELAARLAAGAADRRRSSVPIVLAVGNVLPRKNLGVLAAAIRRLAERGTPTELRIVGKVPAGNERLRDEITAAADGRVTITGYVADDDLVDEYCGADVLAFPSLYEGFGIPVLEAMAAGLPVVASDATALPEAVDGAGLLADPADPDAWADAIESVLTDGQLAASLAASGTERVARLSWADTGRLVLDALRSAAS